VHPHRGVLLLRCICTRVIAIATHSQLAGTKKPQPEKTGARGLSLGFAWGVGSAFGAFIGAGLAG
jgi:hypothetical protein